ncbi:FIST N domain-containing protein [Tindallia magadiensis]|uniref:FIST N domain-containing protein n=1 Tax=Tindallia magadiensis TaxID=69895 RepID=A0A1I3HA36_9FIRM|nr:FIST C-terminal domain-containing protein [Tindallia magadiensis]SFI32417.1 FIST N domain-containing protein [Tindallia magadiensis]
MKIHMEQGRSLETFEKALITLEQDQEITGIMIFACDADQWTPDQLDPLLTRCRKPIWGGIFPEIIFGEQKLATGTLFIGFTQPVKTVIIEDLDEEPASIRQAIERGFGREYTLEQTMFVFADGLSHGIERLRDSLFQTLGSMPNYVGGGAGSLSFSQSPCIFTSRGLQENAAVLTLATQKSGIGVAHGWQQVSKPHKITESKGTHIISIDWVPAFDIYQEIVEALSGKRFQDHDFFHIAKAYPLGIAYQDLEMFVRDPIGISAENHLVCVGDIPTNSIVYVLHGNTESLLAGAKETVETATKAFELATQKQIQEASVTLVIDCISRALFWGKAFSTELNAIKGAPKVIGALTLGEFANIRRDYLAFHNKTIMTSFLE